MNNSGKLCSNHYFLLMCFIDRQNFQGELEIIKIYNYKIQSSSTSVFVGFFLFLSDWSITVMKKTIFLKRRQKIFINTLIILFENSLAHFHNELYRRVIWIYHVEYKTRIKIVNRYESKTDIMSSGNLFMKISQIFINLGGR